MNATDLTTSPDCLLNYNHYDVICHVIGERAKRVRHSQVCSIENRGYIMYIYIVRAKFCSYNP